MSTYTADTNGDIALVAATTKTIMSVTNAAAGIVKLVEISVSFDGKVASNEPVTVELCKCTMAGAGTSTTHTMAQASGPARTVQATAARAYTAEPTVMTVIKRWVIPPGGGGLLLQSPLGRELTQITGSQGIAVRCTAPDAVNAQGYMEIEEG